MTCDRVVIINNGRVVAIDTPAHLAERGQSQSRIYLEVDAPAMAVLTHLRQLPEVLDVELETSATRATCVCTVTTSTAGDCL